MKKLLSIILSALEVSLICFLFLLCISCESYGQLEVKAKLPKILEEVSGIQYVAESNSFWMLNDSGNAPSIYLVTEKGKITREVKINANNTDWEDITLDKQGNLYIGNFGNNANKRKKLHIIKVKKEDLTSDKKVDIERIYFHFPEQKKFPPKKKNMYYDVEGLFEWNGNFYVFAKSRVKNEIGRTFLYRIPNKAGNHWAERIADFTTCPDKGCWITGADISKDGKKVVLLNHTSAWVFTNFTGDNFFSGDAKEYPFGHDSQKESITFKNNSTIYVADEDESGTSSGRNLYLFELE